MIRDVEYFFIESSYTTFVTFWSFSSVLGASLGHRHYLLSAVIVSPRKAIASYIVPHLEGSFLGTPFGSVKAAVPRQGSLPCPRLNTGEKAKTKMWLQELANAIPSMSGGRAVGLEPRKRR